MNKDIIIAQLEDQNQNLAYENQRMAEFIEALGLAPDEITSYVINGNEKEFKRMIDYVIENNT
jgi:hypothetical protein